MKGIYLAACKARHPDYNIVYNDYDKKYNCDLTCDMLSIDLKDYDFVIASPPCNWWSRMRGKRCSQYSLETKHLLPDTIDKCFKECGWQKPFIIENVANHKRYLENGIIKKIEDYGFFYYVWGRHIYITNIMFNCECYQHMDFRSHGYRVNNDGYNQGGSNVHKVIEIWLKYIHESTTNNISSELYATDSKSVDSDIV